MYYPSRRKKSKKLFIIATVVAASVFAGAFILIKNSSNDEVIAKINGQKIFRSDIESKLHDVFGAQDSTIKSPEIEKLPKEVIEILAKEVYLEKELTKQAMGSDAVKTNEVKKKIADSKSKIIRQAYIDSILQKEVTDEQINNKYLELSKDLEGKKEYSVSHIVVKTKEEAEKVAKELKSKKGVKFTDLARKYSIDQESANKGGEPDYILEDSMIKEIAAVVPGLQKDQISEPIQTKFGWHIVKVGDIRQAKPLSFEAVKDNIRDQLIQDKVNEINNKLINDAKIQILIQLKEVEKNKIEEKEVGEAVEPTQENPEATQTSSGEEVKTPENSEVVEQEAVAEEETKEVDETKSKEKSDAKGKKHKAESKR
jgi:peptidyl-prolyl cis-trans isomerase C